MSLAESYTPRPRSYTFDKAERRARQRPRLLPGVHEHKGPRAVPDVRPYHGYIEEPLSSPAVVAQVLPADTLMLDSVLPLLVTARPIEPARAGLAERFEELSETWRDETEFLSTSMARYMHPAYQQIIGMGSDALPLILRSLRDEPGDWYWALAAITGHDAAEGAETPSQARKRWLEWGAEQGHLSW